jgi:hypothetical protein
MVSQRLERSIDSLKKRSLKSVSPIKRSAVWYQSFSRVARRVHWMWLIGCYQHIDVQLIRFILICVSYPCFFITPYPFFLSCEPIFQQQGGTKLLKSI